MKAPAAALPKIQGSHSLFDLLHVFQEGKAHIAAVIGPDGMATSTSFWTLFRAVLGATRPRTRRVPCFTW